MNQAPEHRRGPFLAGLSSALISGCILLVACAAACAQEYPTRPVRVLVPASPGGVTDIVARLMAPPLTDALGKPFVVDNRAGANGIIGTEIVAKAAPDGHTVMVVL